MIEVILLGLLQSEYFHYAVFLPCLPHWYRTYINKFIYIDVLPVIMFIFRFRVQTVPGCSSNLPCGIFIVIEFVSHVVVWTLRGLLPEAVNDCHLLWDKFFRLSIPRGCPEGKFGGWWFLWVFDLSEGWVYLGVGEFDEILVGVYLFFFFLGRFRFSH